MNKILIALIALFAFASTSFARWGLEWNANPEPDIAGYRVYKGTAVDEYTLHQDVGNVTEIDLTDLPVGQYYFVVTAYNEVGLESLPSDPFFVSVVSKVTNLRLKIFSDSISVSE